MTVAAIEAGGTKFVIGLYRSEGGKDSPPLLLARETIPTLRPEETLARAGDIIEKAGAQYGRPEAMGLGSFGPVDLRPGSPTWGSVTSTPKPFWSGVDMAGYFKKRFGLPVAFDTDVNAAAYGEKLWGAARGLEDFVYITVGTGIGGGVVSGGRLVHGLSHPELGHIRLAREPSDPFPGLCPYHGDCLEGLAAGPAIGKRWNCRAEDLPPDHEAWELEATYLARAIAVYALVVSPELVILGGGVGMRQGLAERVSTLLGQELAGYLPALARTEPLSAFVRRPELGSEAGLLGSAALALALDGE
jgi:fructokinase